MSTEKKSVCDGCEHEHLGCRFECKERERFEIIKKSGQYYDGKAEIGKCRTNYRFWAGGVK